MHHYNPSSLPGAALEAVARGWHVIPLVPGCKRPAIRSWESRATTDVGRVASCWNSGRFNVGIVAGRSGLLVVDLDVPKHDQDVPPAGVPSYVSDGADMLTLLAERHKQPVPSATYSVRTASGGTHLYFVAPSGAALRNTAGALGWKIDTRAHGGYVVGAGSVVDGQEYVVVNDVPPAPLPAWLGALLAPAPLPPRGPVAVSLAVTDRRSAYLRAAVTSELARVMNARPGGRNNALYVAAFALGQLVAGGDLDAVDVTDWLTAAALRVDLDERSARATIASGLRSGASRPRTVAGGAAA